MNIHKRVYFEVESDLSNLDKVLGEFSQINESWVNETDWLECQLALAEGFTNAVRHAHKNLPKEIRIVIEIILTKIEIKIQIWDYGLPFDLESFASNLTNNNDKLSIGGRGVEILQKIADELSYTRTKDNRNCLLVVKKLST